MRGIIKNDLAAILTRFVVARQQPPRKMRPGRHRNAVWPLSKLKNHEKILQHKFMLHKSMNYCNIIV